MLHTVGQAVAGNELARHLGHGRQVEDADRGQHRAVVAGNAVRRRVDPFAGQQIVQPRPDGMGMAITCASGQGQPRPAREVWRRAGWRVADSLIARRARRLNVRIANLRG
jgi:hypothetical protein